MLSELSGGMLVVLVHASEAWDTSPVNSTIDIARGRLSADMLLASVEHLLRMRPQPNHTKFRMQKSVSQTCICQYGVADAVGLDMLAN